MSLVKRTKSLSRNLVRAGAQTARVCFLLIVLSTLFDGFSLRKIQGPLLEGTAPPPSLEALEKLNQPYFYFSKGRQCFVFLSADGQSVIKFLNYNRFYLPEWLSSLTTSLQAYGEKRKNRFSSTTHGFELADQYLHHETGLLFVHLRQGQGFPMVTLFDQTDQLHRVDLNQTAFVLQKRATPFFEELKERWELKGNEGVKEVLRDFCFLMQRRCEQQIADDDRDVEANFGFYQHAAMLLDPGRLYLSEELKSPEGISQELRVTTKRLKRHLLKYYPESVSFLDELLEDTGCKINQSNIHPNS